MSQNWSKMAKNDQEWLILLFNILLWIISKSY